MGRKKKKQKSNLDLQVAILFIASIVLAILIYGKPGYIGQNVMPQLENAIGWIQYFVPIAIFAIAVHLACEEDKRTLGIKIIQYLVLTIAITIIITVFNGDTGTIGRSITASLVNLVGRASSVILSLGVIIILSIFMYGIKPAEIVKEIVEERKETISNRPPRESREKIIEPKPAKRKKRSSIDIDIGEDEEEELQEPKISGLKGRCI